MGGSAGDRGDGPTLWFAKRDTGLRIAALTWQGRVSVGLYLFLILVAIVTYSQLVLTAFVVVFYTAALAGVVAYKSDLLENWPPER